MRFQHSVHYEHMGEEPHPYAAAEIATAKWVVTKLEIYYPGHAWHCEVDINARGGIIKVRLNAIMPTNRWYVLKMSDVISDPGGRRTIMKAGGELLERYKIPRTGFMLDHWRAAMDAMPLQSRLNARGHIAPLL